jgi:hypothetical protein
MNSQQSFYEFFKTETEALKGLASKERKLKVIELEQLVYKHCKGYDLKSCLQILKQDTEKEQKTTKKFAFKGKKSKEIEKRVEEVEKEAEITQEWIVSQTLHPTEQNVALYRLDQCQVTSDLLHSTLYVDYSRNSIFVMKARDSVLLQHLEHCTLFVRARQVRIHDCVDCQLFVNCETGPIIERCTQMKFGEWKIDCLDGEESCSTIVNGVSPENSWNQVQDFDWLRQTKSPNWELIESQDPSKFLKA